MAKVIKLADYKEAKARGLTTDDVMTLWDETSEVSSRVWDCPAAEGLTLAKMRKARDEFVRLGEDARKARDAGRGDAVWDRLTALTNWMSPPRATIRAGLDLGAQPDETVIVSLRDNVAEMIPFPAGGHWTITQIAGRTIAASKKHGVWVLTISDAEKVYSWAKLQFPD